MARECDPWDGGCGEAAVMSNGSPSVGVSGRQSGGQGYWRRGAGLVTCMFLLTPGFRQQKC